MSSESDNGYVVYPSNVGFMKLEDAIYCAILDSTTAPDFIARVEDVDTEAVVARFENGKRTK